MKALNVIGCGRVGQTIAKLVSQDDEYLVQDLFSRTTATAELAATFIGKGNVVNELEAMRPADLWMLSVPDSEIASVADALSKHLPATTEPRNSVAFHCSGFFSANILSPLRSRGLHLGSVHPCLNFASPEAGASQFRDSPCGLEGDVGAVEALQLLFEKLGGRCFLLNSSSKVLYHTAAVFCSNFTVVLQGVAKEVWHKADVSDTISSELMTALLSRTVNNIVTLGPRAALTGPAARGDTEVVKDEARALNDYDPVVAQAYEILSLMASKWAKSGVLFEDGNYEHDAES